MKDGKQPTRMPIFILEVRTLGHAALCELQNRVAASEGLVMTHVCDDTYLIEGDEKGVNMTRVNRHVASDQDSYVVVGRHFVRRESLIRSNQL